FGGWVTASSVILPINVYADRVLIGALLPLGALAVYTPAVEVVTRLEVVPTSLVAALFPALSALGIDRTADVERMFGRAMRYLFLLTAPLLIFLFVFAPELLRVWLRAGIAGPATPVFRILLVGELLAILAPVAGDVLWARGRP